MPLLDKSTGRPWTKVHTNRMLQCVRAACQAELNRRDKEAGLETLYSETDEGIVIDREKAALRSTGRGLRMLTVRKWTDFCAEPRDEALYVELYKLDTDPRNISLAEKRLADAIASVPDELAASVKIPGRRAG